MLKALGTPLNANLVSLMNASLGTIGSILLMLFIKKIGRRKIYLTSIMIVTLCSFGLGRILRLQFFQKVIFTGSMNWSLKFFILGIYGFVFLPSGWTSFIEGDSKGRQKIEHIKQVVGNYSYLALAMISIMNFTTRFAIGSMPSIFASEVFPFKSRSFLCSIVTALQYVFAAIATKTYYTIETVFSLSGAPFFYGAITLIG